MSVTEGLLMNLSDIINYNKKEYLNTNLNSNKNVCVIADDCSYECL